ncbi:MAG: PRC-barrel domain-containing protein [Acidobacteriota bacterium]
MDIKINVDVLCVGKRIGEVTCVIIEPNQEKITHLVVQESHFPFTEKIVVLNHVVEADAEKVVLDCTADELDKMENFFKTEFVPAGDALLGYNADELAMTWSSVMENREEQTPAGELTVHQGAKVFATDGHIGKIDDFLIGSKDKGKITHIVLREGHFWDQKNITIPVSEIEKIDDKGIHLKLNKDEIEALPSMKAHNWFS